jgi:hypothetical protein
MDEGEDAREAPFSIKVDEEVTPIQVPSLSEAMNAAGIAQNWNPDRRVVVLDRYGEVVGDIVKKSTSRLKRLPKSKK